MPELLSSLDANKGAIDVIIKILGGIGALIVFFRGLGVYRLQSSLQRFEKFSEMQKRFDTDEDFEEILHCLEADRAAQIANISQTKRAAFLGFFEDIGIMMNSGLIRPEVAFNTWGYWALKARETPELWIGMDTSDDKRLYWAIFHQFADNMQALKDKRSTHGASRFMSWIQDTWFGRAAKYGTSYRF